MKFALTLILCLCAIAAAEPPPEAWQPRSGWTVETAHQHALDMIAAHDARYEQQFKAQQEAIALALAAQKEAVASALTAQEKATAASIASAQQAVAKAETSSDKRFESVNEFRASMNDQTKLYMPRMEAQATLAAVQDKVAALSQRIDKAEGSSTGQNNLWGYLAAGAGFVLAVASFYQRRPPIVGTVVTGTSQKR